MRLSFEVVAELSRGDRYRLAFSRASQLALQHRQDCGIVMSGRCGIWFGSPGAGTKQMVPLRASHVEIASSLRALE